LRRISKSWTAVLEMRYTGEELKQDHPEAAQLWTSNLRMVMHPIRF
jgi:hypothetical protein